jgi:hypothetical protein
MKKLSEISPKKMTMGLGKARVSSHAADVLLGIERVGGDPYNPTEPYNIKCFIHKIHLSGIYVYSDIVNNIGPLFVDSNFDPGTRSPNYKNKFIRNEKDFLLIFFLNPKVPYFPPCYIEIHPKGYVSIQKYKKFLIWFDANLPGLNLSGIEYTSDQFCHGPKEVERLFDLERRYLYVPQSRGCNLIGENYAKFGRKNRLNFVCHNGNVKIYERGPDGQKKEGAWERESINRVRLEYTASRPDIKKNGLENLKQFIESPQFHKMNKGRFRFMCFAGSNKLPNMWEDYGLSDIGGSEGSFQAQHIILRKKVKNIAAYMTKVEHFDPLMKRLEVLWSAFDARWQRVSK